MAQCHRCPAEHEFNEQSMTKDGWDAFVHIDQPNGVTLQTQFCPRHARWWTFRYWARRYQWRIGRLSRKLGPPGYSWCGRCKTTWNYVHGHSTTYALGRACFPLCVKCWAELTPVDRLPYYRQLFDEWGRDDLTWAELKAAVLNEGNPEWPDTIETIQ